MVDFGASDPSTIGMELEFQLLHARTLELADGILPLVELYRESPYVKPEVIQNTVEVASKVCSKLTELEAHLRAVVKGGRIVLSRLVFACPANSQATWAVRSNLPAAKASATARGKGGPLSRAYRVGATILDNLNQNNGHSCS
jgi:carboxylate-amine ligase